jgi:DNA-binding CsgD family transcriptional regulator
MVSVVGFGGREIPPADFLETRFGLKPAEARLVALLFAGASLRSCAKALGIKYETARSYLKSAFLKTGTHRQGRVSPESLSRYELSQSSCDSRRHDGTGVARGRAERKRYQEVPPICGAMWNRTGTPN